MSRTCFALVLIAAQLTAADPPKQLQGGWRLTGVGT